MSFGSGGFGGFGSNNNNQSTFGGFGSNNNNNTSGGKFAFSSQAGSATLPPRPNRNTTPPPKYAAPRLSNLSNSPSAFSGFGSNNNSGGIFGSGNNNTGGSLFGNNSSNSAFGSGGTSKFCAADSRRQSNFLASSVPSCRGREESSTASCTRFAPYL